MSDSHPRIAFVASTSAEAREARERLAGRYGDAEPAAADIIVALGGDGLMLQTLHRFMTSGKPIYGMHRGTVGLVVAIKLGKLRQRGLRLDTRARDEGDPVISLGAGHRTTNSQVTPDCAALVYTPWQALSRCPGRAFGAVE